MLARRRRGHERAAERQLQIVAERGPQPELAIRVLLSTLDSLARMGVWPAPRDEVAARAEAEVRRRWARIGKRAKAARKG